MERREFMLAAGGAVACAGMSPAVALAAGALPGALGRASFAALLGQSLIAYDGARGVALTLTDIRDAKAAPGHQQFSLLLSGSAGSPLQSGAYPVYHASLGTVPLFIEAAGTQDRDALYRVQFSLLG